MIFTKGAHQSATFYTFFECLGEISPNLYSERFLLLGVYKISAKKVQRTCLMILKTGAKFIKKMTCFFKIDKNLVNLDLNTQSLKILHLD